MSQRVEPSMANRAMDALDRHAWQEAYDLLSEADAGGALSADELELLARASWWVGRLPEAIEARERAYAAHVKTGDPVMAAVAATLVGRDNLLKNAHSVARAWMNRAERLLEGTPENPARGWLAVTRAFQAGLEGDFEEASAQASKGREIADRFGDRDLGAVALSAEGMSLIFKGQVAEGLAIVDEATVPAVAGELEPQIAGAVCCATIGACASLGDWLRAAQWTAAQDRWCQRERINGFPGMCRLYRAEIKRFRGDWLEAEAEARRATNELQGFIPAAVGLALYEIGLIRLRRGDPDRCGGCPASRPLVRTRPRTGPVPLEAGPGKGRRRARLDQTRPRRSPAPTLVGRSTGQRAQPDPAASGGSADHPCCGGRRCCPGGSR